MDIWPVALEVIEIELVIDAMTVDVLDLGLVIVEATHLAPVPGAYLRNRKLQLHGHGQR